MADDAVGETAPEDEATEGADDTPEVVVETEFGVPVTTSRGNNGGQKVLHPSIEELMPLATTLAEGGWEYSGLYGVDYLTHPGRTDLPATITAERFEVVVTLINRTERARVRLRVQTPADVVEVPTLCDIWPGTEASEREVFDMFGIAFTDHPDPTRVLMPEDWQGHPLRKDYDIGRIPVQFKGTS